MDDSKQKLGDVLLSVLSNHITITSQNIRCCSLVHTLNAWGPILAERHLGAIVQVMKFQPEYEPFKQRVSDRLLGLFVKKAIRNYLLDNQSRPSYTLVTPTQKEPNDATKEGQQPTDNLDEHPKGDEVRQTSEASNRNRYEQSRNVQRNRKRKKR